jgi:site-specific DNA recombinase
MQHGAKTESITPVTRAPMASLSEALNDVATRSEAADLLRGLIEKVLPHPDPTALHDHRIELFGELAAILSLCNGGLSTNAKARTGGAGFRQVTVVAGAGFEPAAFRL